MDKINSEIGFRSDSGWFGFSGIQLAQSFIRSPFTGEWGRIVTVGLPVLLVTSGIGWAVYKIMMRTIRSNWGSVFSLVRGQFNKFYHFYSANHIQANSALSPDEMFQKSNTQYSQYHPPAIQMAQPLSFSLSKQDVSYHTYTHEGYFREAAYDFNKIMGDGWEKKVNSFSYILIKPDALAARSVKSLFGGLKNYGFEPLACIGLKLTPNTWRSLWRYQLYRAPVGRLVLLDRLYSMSDSYLILIQDVSGSSSFPSASARLKSLKGGAHQHNRKPEDLRSLIGAKTGVLTFIHSPDESIDMMREFGVLLCRKQRYEIAKVILNPSVFDAYEQICEEIPRHSLDVRECVKQIELVCKESQLIVSLCELVKTEKTYQVNAEELLDEFDRLNVQIDPWDIITFCAYFSEAN